MSSLTRDVYLVNTVLKWRRGLNLLTPRRVAMPPTPELRKTIAELEQKQVLEKVITPTGCISHMVAVWKPSRKLRMCIAP